MAFGDLTISGKLSTLSAWQPSEAAWYVSARDAEILRWTNEPPNVAVDDVASAMAANRDRSGLVCLAIRDFATEKPVGNIVAVIEEDSAEIMYWLHADARGKGIATEALQLLSHWVLDNISVNRVTLKTHRDNIRSQLVAQRAGFRRFIPRRSSRSTTWFELPRAGSVPP